MALGEGGAVGERGAGADGVGIGGGDVGDEQGALMARRGCELGEPSPFDGGEVLAQGVHLGDGQAGADQGAIEGGEIGEGDLGIEGTLHHGRGSSADEEEDGGARGDAAQEGEGGVGGVEGVRVGGGMRAAVKDGVGERIGRRLRGDDDGVAAEVSEAVEGLVRGLVHGDGGLADGEDQDLIEVGKRDDCVAEGESAGIAVEVTVDGAAHVDAAHGLGEDGSGLMGERTHAAPLGVVDGPGSSAEGPES